MTDSKQRLKEAQAYWDSEAPTFDNEPDHGLTDTWVRQAWETLLTEWAPSTPSKILDIGCGTGSLSIILAQLGHQVTGIDLSPAMIAEAKRKAKTAVLPIIFQIMDASAPVLPHQKFDAILCRHLLWTLPNRANVLKNWANLLVYKGKLLLVEGYWQAGSGLHAEEVIETLPENMDNVSLQNLSKRPQFWGKSVHDERYAIMAIKVE